LPYDVAILKLFYNLPIDIDEKACERELSEAIQIMTFLTNVQTIQNEFRHLAIEEFDPL